MPTKICRRGHPQTKSNVRTQINRYQSVSGEIAEREAKVCLPCARMRRQKRAAGKPIKDQRRGAR